MRKATSLSKQAILLIHQKRIREAKKLLKKAKEIILELKNASSIAPEEIDVPLVDYVLGLADVIGEYRRLALDALREGDVKKGEKCLKTMDEIYVELMAMDEAYMLVPGLRRKCDVARRIIETTRGDITQEVRRNELEKYLKRFEKFTRKKTR